MWVIRTKLRNVNFINLLQIFAQYICRFDCLNLKQVLVFDYHYNQRVTDRVLIRQLLVDAIKSKNIKTLN